MIAKKVNQYLISGVILCVFALRTEEFEIFYNGIALTIGIAAFFMAYIEYKKTKAE